MDFVESVGLLVEHVFLLVFGWDDSVAALHATRHLVRHSATGVSMASLMPTRATMSDELRAAVR